MTPQDLLPNAKPYKPAFHQEEGEKALKREPYYATIAVDFDGTIVENDFPEIGKPKPLIIQYIKRQAARGTKIILFTCRENGTERALLDEAVDFCRQQEIPLFAINENPENPHPKKYGVTGPGRKVFADLYIDDNAINTADIESKAATEGFIKTLKDWNNYCQSSAFFENE